MYTLALACIIAFHPPPAPTQKRTRGRKTHPFITISPSLRSRFLTTPARFDLYFWTIESFCFTGLPSSPSCWYKNRICATETFCPSRTRHLLIRMRVSVSPSAAFTMMRLALPLLLLPPPPASSASFRVLAAIWLFCDLSSSLVFCILYLQFCIYTDFLRLFKSVACYVYNLCELRISNWHSQGSRTAVLLVYLSIYRNIAFIEFRLRKFCTLCFGFVYKNILTKNECRNC